VSVTRACLCCGQERCAYAQDGEPCYGDIAPARTESFEGDGFVDTIFIHTCEGHKRREYVPEG
jgi:hypothetical protein